MVLETCTHILVAGKNAYITPIHKTGGGGGSLERNFNNFMCCEIIQYHTNKKIGRIPGTS